MRKKTVKRRIFISNALMVLAALFVFLMINVMLIKVYSETIEHEFKASAERVVDEEGLEKMISDFTIKRNGFIVLFLADGILCIVVLLIISQLFRACLAS